MWFHSAHSSSSSKTASFLPTALPLIQVAALAALLVGCGSTDDGSTVAGNATGGAGGAQDASVPDGASQGGTSGADSSVGGNNGGSSGADSSVGGSGGALPDGGADVHVGCPNVGDSQCITNTVQVCTADGSGGRDWQTTKFCSVDTEECKIVSGQAQCVAAPTCFDQKKNQDETGVDCGGATCGPCAAGQSCKNPSDCESGYCKSGVCAVCKPGSFGCYGNYVRKCNADGATWSNVTHCNHVNQVCNPTKGVCQGAAVVGTAKTTGVYYQYAKFCAKSSVFKGGFDVGSLGNKLYVNRDGQHVDVYRVDIQDSDGDGKIEPNQHPANPDAKGPMEKRTLVPLNTYNVQISNGANSSNCTGGWTKASNEIQPLSQGGNLELFFISQWSGRLGVANWKPGSSAVKMIAPWTTGLGCDEVLGYDPQIKTWYIGTYKRRVFSWHAPTKEWALEFIYPALAGVHMDGLEVVEDPNTHVSYVYVTDMTSDFIAQYHKKKNGLWEQTNVFRYNGGAGDYVEGMGFGALNHFWMSSLVNLSTMEECVYEIGGGSLSKYVEPS